MLLSILWPGGLWSIAACGSLAEGLGANPAVCCACCVLSGTGLRDHSSPRPEESYQVCVNVCVSLSVIRCNNITLHQQRVGGRSPTKKEREKECYLNMP
jgi:hypothetical protein